MRMVDFNVGVIIAAAGSGSRLGGLIPKQYCKVLDKPLFLYSLEEFCKISWVKKIALVVDNIEKVKSLLQDYGLGSSQKIALVKGEQSRHRSIRAGLHELQQNDNDDLRIVVVHDGVRPIVLEVLVKDLVISADQHGAAGAIRPLVSTVLRTTADGFLEESLDRTIHVASETPQAFQLSLLSSAYAKCADEELDLGTECLLLTLKHCGVRAKLITGSEDLWKVTYKKDLYTAQACLRERKNDVCIISDDDTQAALLLVDSLSNYVSTVKHVMNLTESEHPSDTKQMTFNTVVVFHVHEIQDQHLVDFDTKLDVDRQGLIIHVIDNANIDGMQTMSVYNLHRSGRTMAHHYEKLHKGVVVIHCVSSNEDQQLVNLISSLILADPTTFSGQTLFI